MFGFCPCTVDFFFCNCDHRAQVLAFLWRERFYRMIHRSFNDDLIALVCVVPDPGDDRFSRRVYCNRWIISKGVRIANALPCNQTQRGLWFVLGLQMGICG